MKELEYPFDAKKILRHRKQIKKNFNTEKGYLTKKVAILSGSTVGEFQNILELFLLNNGIKPIFWQGQYNRYYEESVFENAELLNFQPDIVYLHTSIKNITQFPNGTEDEKTVDEMLENEYGKYVQIWESLLQKLKCPIIQNNFEALPYRLLGNADFYQVNGNINYVNKLNMKFAEAALHYNNLFINDLNYEASFFGLNRWFDQNNWYLYKYPFSLEAIPLVAFNISNIIKSLFGKNKKLLILDLDNTLWGGVIGEVGAENIKIGIETAEGMAYTDFQNYIKALSQNGIMLSVCSKNDFSIAKEGFSNPACILSLDDFLSFKANWKNKDENIKEIIKEINIMPDSAVFIDDNPSERALIKQTLPEVSVLDIDSPSEYVDFLDKQGFFETTLISQDDKKRNEYYKANIKRENLKSSYTDYQEYLKSLSMKLSINDIKPDNIERVVQLINKTNQFNLTTYRYTYDDVLTYIKDNTINIVGKLSDKFGENGIITCMMASIKNDMAYIDLWIMSCRVFKRDLEKAIFDVLVSKCKEKNIKVIRGFYFKTKKNAFVEHLYEDLGFEVIEQDNEHGIYEYTIENDYKNLNTVMEVSYE